MNSTSPRSSAIWVLNAAKPIQTHGQDHDRGAKRQDGVHGSRVAAVRAWHPHAVAAAARLRVAAQPEHDRKRQDEQHDHRDRRAVARPVLGEEAAKDREAHHLGRRARSAPGQQVHLVEDLERRRPAGTRASRAIVGSISGNVT